MAIKNWLKASYETHGNSTSKTSKPKPQNTLDTPVAKVKAAAAKATDMAKTTRQGDSKGGGKSSISKDVPVEKSNNKIMKGLMGDGAVKPNQKRGSY